MTIALAALCISACNTVSAETLELCSRQTVNGSDILLKDIVKDPAVLPNGWGDRVVMKSPSPGAPEEYSISSIAYALQKYPDMQTVTLRGNINMTITRGGGKLSNDAVKRLLEKYVTQNDKWKGVKYQVKCDPVAETISLSASNSEMSVIDHAAQAIPNHYLFRLAIIETGGNMRTASVSTVITPLRDVWAAKIALARGQTISRENLYTQAVPEDDSDQFIPADEPIDGMEIGHTVKPEMPITRHSLVQPVCVQQGDLININVQRGGLTAVLRAKALSKGRKGEQVICMNEQSKRRLPVRLTGIKEATIDF